jgi:hypothetical protein
MNLKILDLLTYTPDQLYCDTTLETTVVSMRMARTSSDMLTVESPNCLYHEEARELSF